MDKGTCAQDVVLPRNCVAIVDENGGTPKGCNKPPIYKVWTPQGNRHCTVVPACSALQGSMKLLGFTDFVPPAGKDMQGLTWDWCSSTCLLGCGFAPLRIDLTKEIAVQYPPTKVQLVHPCGRRKLQLTHAMGTWRRTCAPPLQAPPPNWKELGMTAAREQLSGYACPHR